MFRPLHHFLRILLLSALFSLRAFLLNHSKRLCHVFDLTPNFKAYVDRGVLRSRHGDTIAGSRIDLDDLLLLQFVLRTEDKPCIVGAALEIVDDHPFDLRSKRSQDIRYQIVGERPFLLRVLHEHRDRRTAALIDKHHESLVLVAKENCPAAARRSHGANLNFDNGLTHTASLTIRLHATIRMAVRMVADPTTVSRVLEEPDVSPDLLVISSRPFHHKPAASEPRRALLQLVVETKIKCRWRQNFQACPFVAR